MTQGTAYSFALVLALFLAGDAAGLFYGARVVARVGSPRRLFMLLQAGMALLALGGVLLVHLAHRWFGLADWYVFDQAYKSLGSFGGEARLLAWVAVGCLCVVPAAFLLGMSFPIAQKAVQQDLGQVGRRVGLIQLANILGNTAGALVTGLVLLHLVGTAGTLLLLGLAGFLFAVALAVEHRRPWSYAAAGALALLLALMPGNRSLWASLHGSGAEDARVREDRTGVAVVVDRPMDGSPGGAQSLYVGGRWQSQMNPYPPVQGAMGLLAAHVHPEPRSILIIGYGGGGSTLATTSSPRTERVHVVEIVEPVIGVVRAHAEASAGAVPDPLADPRVEVTVADGRHRLLVSPETYDVVLAEAIVPEAAHSGVLFSVEFFRQVRERLNPGGICVEWAPTQRTIDTFRHVFPHVTRTGNVLIGSEEPIGFSLTTFEGHLRGPAAGHMRAGGWLPENILAWLRQTPVRTWGPGDAPPSDDINTDLFPKDEYYLNNGRWW